LFDARFGFFELLAAGFAQLHSSGEEIERAVEGEIARFEFFDYFFEFVQRGFEIAGVWFGGSHRFILTWSTPEFHAECSEEDAGGAEKNLDFASLIACVSFSAYPASRQQINLMLQSLLAERFNLRLHRETKEVPMYLLTAENYRTHFRENTSGGELRVTRGSKGQLVFENAPVSQVTWFLSVRLRSDVEDKTGLTGKYDFELAPMPTGPENADQNPNSSVFMPPGSDGPSVFATLVREQLGLKLTATKGPVELLVIDHAEKPSAN
jgi:uncharacterized protein (TIGR03435 family)